MKTPDFVSQSRTMTSRIKTLEAKIVTEEDYFKRNQALNEQIGLVTKRALKTLCHTGIQLFKLSHSVTSSVTLHVVAKASQIVCPISAQKVIQLYQKVENPVCSAVHAGCTWIILNAIWTSCS